jgi:hypothetical protein
LIQVQQIGFYFLYQPGQIGGGIFQIEFPFLHPIQTECSGAIFQTVQAIHPGGVLRERNLAKADQGDSHAAADKASDEFASVRPHSAQRVSGNQNVHESSAVRMKAAGDAFFALPMSFYCGIRKCSKDFWQKVDGTAKFCANQV